MVGVLERHGGELRIGVWLEHIRFALWTDRQWLLGIVTRRTRVRGDVPEFVDYAAGDPAEVELEPGAAVRRLGHKDGETRVRYLGDVEVDGWVPDEALADRAPARDFFRLPIMHSLSAAPGSVIRSEPKWASRELAVMAYGFFVDELKTIDADWAEVVYADSDVRVHGFYSRNLPPDRVHRPAAPEHPPTPVTPNAVAPSGTCVYARAGGDAVGFIVGDRDVDLEPGADGWSTLATDTPWGPIVFAAHGVSANDLAACAPAGSVPPPRPPAVPAP
jgi:hypothetical protein